MRAYGPLRTELQRSGKPIDSLDTLIAAHALALGATLVTSNVDEFSRLDCSPPRPFEQPTTAVVPGAKPPVALCSGK